MNYHRLRKYFYIKLVSTIGFHVLHILRMIDACEFSDGMMIISYCENSNAILQVTTVMYLIAILDYIGLSVVYILYKELQMDFRASQILPPRFIEQQIPERMRVDQSLEEEKSNEGSEIQILENQESIAAQAIK